MERLLYGRFHPRHDDLVGAAHLGGSHVLLAQGSLLYIFIYIYIYIMLETFIPDLVSVHVKPSRGRFQLCYIVRGGA